MKIIVNSEREREIIESFSEFLADWIDSKEMEKLLKHADYDFEPHELDLLRTGFWEVNHKVDEKEFPIYLQSENLSGECKYCGGQWRGIEDEFEVTVEDYERYLKSEKEYSYHAECLRERTCVNCGNDDTFDLKDMREGMCKDCYNEHKEESE